jgi:hypothetical protein
VPDALRAVLAQSGRWGRIKAEAVCAMTSKYAMALYELIQLRAGLDRSVEQLPLDRFRDLLGVPPGKLTRGPDFMRFCVEPALLEVNGLSEMGVHIQLIRAHARAPALPCHGGARKVTISAQPMPSGNDQRWAAWRGCAGKWRISSRLKWRHDAMKLKLHCVMTPMGATPYR